MEWLPIDSAPTDGAFLVWSAENNRAYIASYDPDGTAWVECEDGMTLEKIGNFPSGGGWFQRDEITHWMPLPTPPNSNPKEAGGS